MRSKQGFTLLEMLVALFIFTILSMMLAGALRNVIDAQSGTEMHAARLRDLQFALVKMSRDIEQAVNRPITNAEGKEDAAFFGTPGGFVLTHTGFANFMGITASSALQRTQYRWKDSTLWRTTWSSLDQTANTQAHLQPLLENVSAARFEYLDSNHKFHTGWPVQGQFNQPLPRAVKIYLTISNWGSISQTYVIPAEPSKIISPAIKP